MSWCLIITPRRVTGWLPSSFGSISREIDCLILKLSGLELLSNDELFLGPLLRDAIGDGKRRGGDRSCLPGKQAVQHDARGEQCALDGHGRASRDEKFREGMDDITE